MQYKSKFILACSISMLMAGTAMAHEELPAADGHVEADSSPHHLTTNLGLYSDYLFRGISYARGRGALQLFIDYSHESGLFFGIGGTNVHKDAIYGNTLEVDVYGGYSHALTEDLIGTIGFMQYYYPDNEKIAGQSANVTEINLALDYRHFTLRYSHSLTDWFGVNTKSYGNTQVGHHTTGRGDSKGSNYVELNYNNTLPFYDLNLMLHVGHQTVENYAVADYTDIAIGLSKDFSIADSKGWNAGLSYIMTDANDDWYVTSSGYKTGDNKFFGYIKRTF